MDSSSILTSLNENQAKAVSAPKGNYLIVAGAGTGKTTVLTRRVSYLINVENVKPFNILAVTFTNKAAFEMRSRILDLVGDQAKSVWCMTFPSASLRILQNFAQYAGLKPNFKIIVGADQKDLVKEIITNKDIDVGDCLKIISRIKMSGGLEQYLEKNPNLDNEYINIYNAYQKALIDNNSLDFDELILRSYNLIKDNELIRKFLHEKFKEILIDEFQDTSTLQYEWLKMITGQDAHVFAVGDDDQSIYTWRDADSRNMFRFKDEFSNVNMIALVENYRSTSHILDCANRLIKLVNKRVIEKELIPTVATQTNTPKVSLVKIGFESESNYLKSIISYVRNNFNAQYSDIAILYRFNYAALALESALLKNQIPYHVYSSISFMDREEIKTVMMYLFLIVNLNDNSAFLRIINTPKRGIGKVKLDAIKSIAKESNISLFEALVVYNKNNKGKSKNILSEFINKINLCRQEIFKNELTAGDFVDFIINQFDLYEYYKDVDLKKTQENAKKIEDSDEDKTKLTKVENLKRFIDLINNLVSEDEMNFDDLSDNNSENVSNQTNKVDLTTDLVTRLNNLPLNRIKEDEGGDKISLMTIHSAKGLEFKHVIIWDFEEDIIPYTRERDDYNQEKNEAQIEEEKRLAYVAITRAKESLWLMFHERGFTYFRGFPTVRGGFSPLGKGFSKEHLSVINFVNK